METALGTPETAVLVAVVAKGPSAGRLDAGTLNPRTRELLEAFPVGELLDAPRTETLFAELGMTTRSGAMRRSALVHAGFLVEQLRHAANGRWKWSWIRPEARAV